MVKKDEAAVLDEETEAEEVTSAVDATSVQNADEQTTSDEETKEVVKEEKSSKKQPSTEERKRRFGDRKDGYRLRDIDSMHKFIPYLLPHRADNEAVLDTQVDISKALEFLDKKNSESGDDFKYTIFHLMIAALAKTIYLRPKMNYFIQGHRLYERNNISFSFMVKKQFTDTSKEGFAIFNVNKTSKKSVIDQIHARVKKIVKTVRVENKNDGTTDVIDKLVKLPRFMLKIVGGLLKFLDYHGWMPKSLTKEDPYYTSVFITNLGSIGMDANYHHLVNYGTNSFFVIIGKMKYVPVFNEDGTYEMKHVVDVGMTIDERIADGLYFAKTLKLFTHIINNPELIDRPVWEAIDIEL